MKQNGKYLFYRQLTDKVLNQNPKSIIQYFKIKRKQNTYLQMSNPEQDQAEGRRKSSRQRVPNAYYTAGINELKKITLKAQSKKNRNQDDDDLSSQEELNMSDNARNYHQNYSAHEKLQTTSKWLPCILPHTNKHIKVQIVMDSSQSPMIQPLKHKEEIPGKQSFYPSEPQQLLIPSYNSGQISKKSEPQGALNLLSLFEKVIKNVSNEVPSPVKQSSHSQNLQGLYGSSNLEELSVKNTVSNQKQSKVPVLAPPPKRMVEEDKDGKILSCKVDKKNKKLTINHSKIGEYEIPMQVEPPEWNVKDEQLTQEETQMVSEFRKKLQLNPGLLKSISILGS